MATQTNQQQYFGFASGATIGAVLNNPGLTSTGFHPAIPTAALAIQNAAAPSQPATLAGTAQNLGKGVSH